ncbi:MAG TPA: Sec-independent protein translocase protein TatB [Micropepsaceae bacterium]|nr:Sec-independent protein translocase protein TatB [Micropepsaceae bacterium]
MFDIAWSELFVIIIVALVVVGPKDLPKLMRKVGQWAGRARAMADQFRRSFDDMARQSELEELRSEVNRLKSDAIKPMTDADYEAFGIPVNSLPAAPTIEDVGAAPPVLDTPPTHVEPAPPPAPVEAAAEPVKSPDPV